MSLVSDATALTKLKPEFYTQIEKNFRNSYLAELLVEGLDHNLVAILRNSSSINIERNSEAENQRTCNDPLLVVHIDSIKLILKGVTRDTIGIQTLTHKKDVAGGLIITIWSYSNHDDLLAEFLMVGEYGNTEGFYVVLPNTWWGNFSRKLSQLRVVLMRTSDEELPEKLKKWEFYEPPKSSTIE